MSDDRSLANWLLEQIAEDERLARDGSGACAHLDLCDDSGGEYYEAFGFAEGPVRVLAECDAKRQIIAQHQHLTARSKEFARMGEASRHIEVTRDTVYWVLLRLALPYADRPGYREEWRPDPHP